MDDEHRGGGEECGRTDQHDRIPNRETSYLR
jgi:hypothetical protein